MTLEQLAELNVSMDNHYRDTLERYMDAIGEIKTAYPIAEKIGDDIYIVLGHYDICYYDEKIEDYYEVKDKWIYKLLPSKVVREILKKFPEIIKKLKTKLAEDIDISIDCSANCPLRTVCNR